AVGPDSTGGGTGSVGWHFAVADGALDFLAAGQTLTQSYDVTLADGHGGSASQTVTISITGSNDAPVISGHSDGAVSELAASAGSSTLDTASGSVSFTDLDLTDTHSATVAAPPSGYLGTFSLDAVGPDSTGGGTGSVGWHFAVADGALDFLAAGQTLTQSYDVTLADGHGGSASQTVTISITGSNDAPVISGHSDGAVSELAASAGSSTLDTASGSVSFTDLDLTDTHSATVAAPPSGYLGTFSLDAVGPDSTGGGTGSVGWHFAVADGALDFLAAGQTLTQSYDVTLADGHGGSASQTVTISITGSNDAPVISGHSDGAVSELAASAVSSTLDTASGSGSVTDCTPVD